jgi:hypothetical protein
LKIFGGRSSPVVINAWQYLKKSISTLVKIRVNAVYLVRDMMLLGFYSIAKFLGEHATFYDINLKEQITTYLDTKMKIAEHDPDKK